MNPNLTTFFFAFLPRFVSPGEPHGLRIELSAVFMALTFAIFARYGGAVAAVAREQIISRPRVLAWMRRVFAGSIVALSAKLALARHRHRGVALVARRRATRGETTRR